MDKLAPVRRPGRRIVVVGTTGSGKTTTARRLAANLGYPHVELDALHWEPNWTPAPVEVFRRRVREVTRAACWVVDGNYSQVRDVLWPAADTIVWLDYALPVIMGRLLRRTARRALPREELWNGNRANPAVENAHPRATAPEAGTTYLARGLFWHSEFGQARSLPPAAGAGGPPLPAAAGRRWPGPRGASPPD